jgi:hypothetical protein
MSSSPAPLNTIPDPAEHWNALLRPLLQGSSEFLGQFQAALRGKNLIFGGRIHCPFLRPFFLSAADEERVRQVAETMVELAERVTSAALEDPALLKQFHLDPDEERLVRMHNGYGPASTASRLDAFLLPHTLKFAEYNGESPAGAGYAETLAEVFETLPVMQEFSKTFEVQSYPLSAALLDALVMSYRDWGGASWPPQMAIVDWREVPTWSEFEILQRRFESMGVPVELADPRTLIFDGKSLSANEKKIDLVYRRVLLNDIVARPSECKALVDAYAARAVCVANHFRCKIPHVKTFFAVLTDERNGGMFSFDERQLIREHVPWTRVVADVSTAHYGEHIDLLAFIRRNRQNLVLKPSDEYGGSGVTLGWESTEKVWDTTLEKIISGHNGTWIVQERIPIRRENFPCIAKGGEAVFRNMLVDFAPYLFRGKVCGFLTRLSATGLANVTSGGGQVPVFRVNFKPHE